MPSAKIPLRGPGNKTVVLTGYSTTEILRFVKLLYGPNAGRSGLKRFGADRGGPTTVQTRDVGRPPKWQAIRDYILSLPRASGFAHSTDDIYAKFFGRKLSYMVDTEMQVAKTTAANLRHAHTEIAHELHGSWVSDELGARNKGGTKTWRFVPV